MEILTERLILRELTSEDTPALCEVLCDSEIMQYYPCVFDEVRVLYSYMKHENVPSAKTAMSYGARFAEIPIWLSIVPPTKAAEQYERTAILYHQQYTSKSGAAESYEDGEVLTDVYAVTREEWEKIRAVR